MTRRLAWLAAAGLVAAVSAAAHAEEPVALPVTIQGMTYLASHGSKADVQVEARRARFDPASNRAELEEVRARMAGADDADAFAMTCDRGELQLSSNDFVAKGNVRGTMADGRRFRTDWVHYDAKRGVAYTDAPVEIADESGTYSGVGFRYLVREKRFRLLGGANVVQRP